MSTRLILMGLRASGKTTLGRLAAEKLAVPFADLDDLAPPLLARSTPAEAIEIHGLDAFRAAERDALAAWLDTGSGVLALGGGAPTAPGAAELLRQASNAHSALSIYLHASPSELRTRLKNTDIATRPSLTGRGTLDEIEELYAARDPLYRELADHVLDADLQLASRGQAELERALAALADRIAALATDR